MSEIIKLPNELIFLRHGESEENFAMSEYKNGRSIPNISEIYDRPNWKSRLSETGIEQVKRAKLWVDREMGGIAVFNALYVSPYLRTRETAIYLGDENTNWLIDDRIGEREWGEYGETPIDRRDEMFPATKKNMDGSIFWSRPPGGENAPDVNRRLNNFINMLGQEHDSQKVLAVTHGGFMRVARYNLERMMPEEYEASVYDPKQEIKNCTILRYSRVNPRDADDIRSQMTWRQIIHPCDEQNTPNNYDWLELENKRGYYSSDLHKQLEIAANLIDRKQA